MKNILLLLLLFSLASCSDWFDVNPSSVVNEDELFSSEIGFYEALTGVYIKATDPQLYGQSLSYKTLEVMANQYDVSGEQEYLYNNLMNLDFKNVSDAESRLSLFWSKLYTLIASCNDIVENLEKYSTVDFAKNNREMVEAEARALRAYFHFDLLRMYGYSPKADFALELKSIPYVNKLSTEPYEPLLMTQVLDSIINDLSIAKELLENDPVKTEVYDIPNNIGDYYSDNGFRQGRNYRMNYWAVTSVLARVNLYKGDMIQAYKYAKEVYESDYAQFADLANYSWDKDVIAGFYKKESEIFSLSEQYFSDESRTNLNISNSKLDNLYEKNTAISDADLRALVDFKQRNGIGAQYSTKILGEVPICKSIIKRSEIYLILAETAEENGDDPYKYLNELRASRGLVDFPVYESLPINITKEYKKEFFAEGELFYYYKRIGISSMFGANFKCVTDFVGKCVLPIPYQEYEFGKYNN